MWGYRRNVTGHKRVTIQEIKFKNKKKPSTAYVGWWRRWKRSVYGKWDACLFAHVCCVVGLYEERVHSLSRENVNTNVLYVTICPLLTIKLIRLKCIWLHLYWWTSVCLSLVHHRWESTMIFRLLQTTKAPPLSFLYIVTAQRSGQQSTGGK
jgi:hypothetical protein